MVTEGCGAEAGGEVGSAPANFSESARLAESLRRCRETRDDVLPEPGLRYRQRALCERNAKRAREGDR